MNPPEKEGYGEMCVRSRDWVIHYVPVHSHLLLDPSGGCETLPEIRAVLW